jgi:hypothetical protein
MSSTSIFRRSLQADSSFQSEELAPNRKKFSQCKKQRFGERQEFIVWVRAINHPDIDLQKEFPDVRLRSVTLGTDQRAYLAQRQRLTINEQDFINQPQPAKPAHADSGMWGGIPGFSNRP